MNLLRGIELLLTSERKRFWWVLLFGAAAAIAQTVALLAVMPFIVLLTSPDLIESNAMLARAYIASGADSAHEFLLMLGLLGGFSLLFGNILVAAEHWLSVRFLTNLNHRLERDIFANIMNLPYMETGDVHSGSFIDILQGQVDRFVEGVVGTNIVIISNAILAVFIVTMLLIVSFKTTLIVLAGLLILYLFVFFILRHSLARHGEELTHLSSEYSSNIIETLAGLVDIKTRRAAEYFMARFEKSRGELTRLEFRFGILSLFPHLLLESLVFIGLIAAALYLVMTTDSVGLSLAYLALYGMATYRIIPTLKGVFEGLAELQHNYDSVRAVARFLPGELKEETVRTSLSRPIKTIEMQGVTYVYDDDNSPGISNIDITLQAGTSVCLFGPSGSGKSTLLGLLAGVLSPQQGRILINDQELDAQTLESWRDAIGYCPQKAFLFNDTIASNIAFGVEKSNIDMSRVRAAAATAELDEFVVQERDQGYETVIGEGGESLSGGQRQRVGIARALYHDPDVLIFDESFSGLEMARQSAILDRLLGLTSKFVILSTHDADIARQCDSIISLEAGRLAVQDK